MLLRSAGMFSATLVEQAARVQEFASSSIDASTLHHTPRAWIKRGFAIDNATSKERETCTRQTPPAGEAASSTQTSDSQQEAKDGKETEQTVWSLLAQLQEKEGRLADQRDELWNQLTRATKHRDNLLAMAAASPTSEITHQLLLIAERQVEQVARAQAEKAAKERIEAEIRLQEGSYAPKAKTVLLDKGEVKPVGKNFKSQFQLEKYLDKMGLECLRRVGRDPIEDVDRLEDLVEGVVYQPVTKNLALHQRVDLIDANDHHLVCRRDEEFFNSLVPAVAEAEGVDERHVVKLPEERTIYGEDGKTTEVELDAVLRVDKGSNVPPVVYVGSAKTYCNGDSEAKELYGTVCGLRALSSSPPDKVPAGYHAFAGCEVKGAFMAEHLGPKGAMLVPKYCQRVGLLQMTRSSGSITPRRVVA